MQTLIKVRYTYHAPKKQNIILRGIQHAFESVSFVDWPFWQESLDRASVNMARDRQSHPSIDGYCQDAHMIRASLLGFALVAWPGLPHRICQTDGDSRDGADTIDSWHKHHQNYLGRIDGVLIVPLERHRVNMCVSHWRNYVRVYNIFLRNAVSECLS